MGEQGDDSRRTVHVRRTMGYQGLLAYTILEIDARIQTTYSYGCGSLRRDHLRCHGEPMVRLLVSPFP
jgi:hypothetical protein